MAAKEHKEQRRQKGFQRDAENGDRDGCAPEDPSQFQSGDTGTSMFSTEQLGSLRYDKMF
jgi:hypothetical protein